MQYQIEKHKSGMWVIWSKPLDETREGYWLKHSQHKTRKAAMNYATLLAGWSGKVELIK